MKYMGSKNRHAKELLQIILSNRQDGQWYVEPFVGGFNIIDKVSGNRIGNDSHFYLISLFQAIQVGWNPPEIVTEESYNHVRNNKELYAPEFVGFVGFGCSYSGKWFGGYARGNDLAGHPRNYANESRKNILKQRPNIKDIIIYNKNYLELDIPENSIVYCDPPYAGTTNYKDRFDHTIFWEWCRKLYQTGHTVFISEYSAPDDFECLWAKQVNNTLVKNTGSKKGIEKLFTLKK